MGRVQVGWVRWSGDEPFAFRYASPEDRHTLLGPESAGYIPVWADIDGSDGIPRITATELRDAGYLQEANRLFFHPLGLALEVIADSTGTPADIGGVWDFRHDPTGVAFDEADPDKAARVAEAFATRSPDRQARLGFVIQPVGPSEVG